MNLYLVKNFWVNILLADNFKFREELKKVNTR